MSTPLQISATIVDRWGTEASTVIYGQMDSTETLTDVIALAEAQILALDHCTDGRIRRASVELPLSVVGTGMKTSPVATGSKVEQTGLLGFSATGTSKRYSFPIPAVSNSVMVFLSDRLNFGIGEPVELFTAGWLNPSGNSTFRGCNEYGQPLSDYIDALVSFRNRRRQLQRSSLEAAP